MSVQVSYSKQLIFGLIALLIIFAVIEGIVRAYEFLNPNCTFVNKDAYADLDFFLIRQMCEDLENRLFIHGDTVSVNAPNQHSKTININSFGFRGDEIYKDKPDDVFRIFVVGGSTVFGYGATSDETTIPGFLQEEFNSEKLGFNVEVINAGNPASDSLDEVFFVKKIVQEFNPDLFIIYDGWNDAAHKIRLDRSDNLRDETQNKDDFFKFKNFPFYRTPFVINEIFFFDPSDDGLIMVDESETPQKVELWLNRWSEICQLGNSVGFSTIVTVQPLLGTGEKILSPDEQKLVSSFPERHNLLPVLEEMANGLSKLDPSCTETADLRNIFDGVDKPIFYDVGHSNDLGNKLIAQKLFELSYEYVITDKRYQSDINN